MSHDWHEKLPGYSEAQVLHDGCAECEYRATLDDHGLSSLDTDNFAQAWARAAAFTKTGLPDMADAERPLLSMLSSMQIQFERRGVRIGEFPTRIGVIA